MGKTEMKSVLVVVASLIAGFFGGFVGTRLGRVSEPAFEGVIRSRKFELVDESGRTISFWGINRDNYAVLAFGNCRSERAGAGGRGEKVSANVEDPRSEYLAMGVVDNNPFVDLKGSDGQTRMNFAVTMHDKPIVWMGDESGPRLHLGVMMSDTPGPADNDWGLAFEPDRAFIGMLTRREGQRRFVRGLVTVDKRDREILYKGSK